MSDMEIRKIPVEQLNPAKYNPRKDLKPGDAEYEKLLRSVDEFGYVEPVIWNRRTGNIVGGHQRFKVLKQLGYKEIECVIVDLDDQREKALNIALNKISGEFDEPLLNDLLQELREAGFDTDLTGFVEEDIDKLAQELDRKLGATQEDDFDAEAEAEKIITPVTKPGDIWQIGRHRLMCGDSTDIGQVARLMDGQRARMIFTDPPWNVNYGGNDHPSWKRRQILNDSMSSEDFYQFLCRTFKAAASVCEAGAMTYVVMSAQEFGALMYAMKECSYHWSSTIIWNKDSHVLSRKDYHTKYEPLWYGWLEGKGLCHLRDRGQNDVWDINRPKKSIDHPMMKPVALPARAIDNSSRKGDVILDLFGGSGTVLIAAEQKDRVCHMMELSEVYCDVIITRFINFMKTDAGIYLLRGDERLAWHEVDVQNSQ